MPLDLLPVPLVEMLRERGVKDDEIESALAAGTLHFLAVDQLLGSPNERMMVSEVAEASGLDAAAVRRLWRALGFTDFEESDAIFTGIDVRAAQSLRTVLANASADTESLVQLARVMGTSMARFAEAQITSSFAFGNLGDGFGDVDEVDLADRFMHYAAATVPALPQLLVYTWIRHLHAAARRAVLAFEKGAENVALVDVAVGFVDLVGFTTLSQQLSEAELASVVSRFEAVSYDSVGRFGGRVVKMIGDEVMFVAESRLAACEAGLAMAEIYRHDPVLSDVRAGIAFGKVLSQDGDYFGPVVNMASRMVNIAEPGTILISESVCNGVKSQSQLVARPLAPRYLKDIGSVPLYEINRAEPPTSALGRGSAESSC